MYDIVALDGKLEGLAQLSEIRTRFVQTEEGEWINFRSLSNVEEVIFTGWHIQRSGG